MTCPTCGAAVAAGARFCEGCGTQLGQADVAPTPTAVVDDHPLGDAPISAPTRKPASSLPDPPPAGRRPCADCGGEVGPDLYCLECGTKAPSERDHFREQPAPWVAGVCDKGVNKARNEDAMALLAGAEPGSRAVLVVMDGVSNSVDSDVASLAGARAAREVLRMPFPAGMGTTQGKQAAGAKVLADATAAANTAIIAVTDPDSTNPASATFSAAVLEGTQLSWGNIGDSRTYWIPDAGTPLQLSVDDSVAQEQMSGGMARAEAETGPQAHAITKWLGRDSEDFVPSVGTLELTESGWVLACSDGLWNYCSEPEAMAAQLRAAGSSDPAAIALALVAFANASGGHDNITAALARVQVGPLPPPPPPAAPSKSATPASPPPPPPPDAPAPDVVQNDQTPTPAAPGTSGGEPTDG